MREERVRHLSATQIGFSNPDSKTCKLAYWHIAFEHSTRHRWYRQIWYLDAGAIWPQFPITNPKRGLGLCVSITSGLPELNPEEFQLVVIFEILIKCIACICFYKTSQQIKPDRSFYIWKVCIFYVHFANAAYQYTPYIPFE